MNIYRKIPGRGELSEPLHLALGVFDGVHLGHQAVIRAAIERQQNLGGSCLVVTFDPHPARVLAPEEMPKILTGIGHKAWILRERLGVRNILAIPFDRAFSILSGQEFVERLTRAGQIKTIAVGKGFQFGKRRSGNVELLRAMGAGIGFEVLDCDLVPVDGDVVSSTRIRKAVAEGDFEQVARFLGRKYSVLGTVVQGRQMGRTIGFPTANLKLECEQLPPHGVYAVYARGQADWHPGVVNLGYRPTVEGAEAELLLEVHLIDFEADLYGQPLEIEFVQFIRGEQKFDGIESLQSQIRQDVDKARRMLHG